MQSRKQPRVRGTLTELRPAGDGDVDRLVAWHDDPEIGRYWDWETFTPDELRARLARDDVDAWIVEAEGGPIGYLQVHPEGLDMFLVPGARGPRAGPGRRPRDDGASPRARRTRVTVHGVPTLSFSAMRSERTSTPR